MLKLLKELDVPPRQVLIEAKLIELDLNDTLDLGVQWDWLSLDQGKALGKAYHM